MNIRIPRWLVVVWNAFEVWANVPVYERGWIEIRRIDLLLMFFFVVCVAWYGYTGGWHGALIGGVFYIFMLTITLWLL